MGWFVVFVEKLKYLVWVVYLVKVLYSLFFVNRFFFDVYYLLLNIFWSCFLVNILFFIILDVKIFFILFKYW